MKSMGGLFVMMVATGCAGHSTFGGDDSGNNNNNDSGPFDNDQWSPSDGGTTHFGDGSTDSGTGGATTVYCHTDDTLYTLDPTGNVVTQIGAFTGYATGDTTITDLAVDSAGDVYVNSETNVYKATVPTSPGSVALTLIHAITVGTGQKFYALAFTPANAIDPNEILIGGDNNGELYAIDTGTGVTKDLGHFGSDPSNTCAATGGCIFSLSGDIVFYMDASNNPLGLATVRSCPAVPSTTAYCTENNDLLIAVDMAALKTAYTSGTPGNLRKGIYGTSGTGYGELFGLGAWGGTVYAFARYSTSKYVGPNNTPLLITIDTTTGKGTVASSSFTFQNGWSGAGVTTSAPITVPLPN